jgi:hypothetical protein
VPHAPEVELLWWRGCPSWEEAIELTRAEMKRRGLDPEKLDVREVRNHAEAERERFAGSPTIRVGGRDIDGPADARPQLTCRVYRLRDGRISALPDPADVGAALEAALKGGQANE